MHSALSGSKIRKFRWFIFLKDIFILACTAFGGPEMHLALFQKKLVNQNKYLKSSELIELFSICQLLPGPTSTQTITLLGYRQGGIILSCLTLLVWILPAVVTMTILSIFYTKLPAHFIHNFRFLEPLVVSFVLVSALKMYQSIEKTSLTKFLIFLAFFVAAILRHPLENYIKTPYIFPFLIIIGGIISFFKNKHIEGKRFSSPKFNWIYFFIFLLLFAGSGIIVKLTGNIYFKIFENNFRFGTLVYGGGNVLFPMIFEQFVNHNNYVKAQDLIFGIGLVQIVPGPVFSITAFLSGLINQSHGIYGQIFSSFIGSLGIFLPGILILFFVYPLWNSLHEYRFFKRALQGIIATSIGLILASSYLLFLPVGFNWIEPNNFYFTNLSSQHSIKWINFVTILPLSALLYYTKIAAPIWVLICIILGFII